MRSGSPNRELADAGLAFVLFRYEEVPAERLTEGQRAAFRSARLWQERLMRHPFHVPADAVQKVHPRREGEADAISFEYQTEGYSVEVFHVMNKLAIVLHPTGGKAGESPAGEEPVSLSASALVHSIFQTQAGFDLVVEEPNQGGVLRRQRRAPGRSVSELSPLELLQWWCQGDEIGFGAEKVTPMTPGKVPSTAGLSPQQVFMWFDTFTTKRYQ